MYFTMTLDELVEERGRELSLSEELVARCPLAEKVRKFVSCQFNLLSDDASGKVGLVDATKLDELVGVVWLSRALLRGARAARPEREKHHGVAVVEWPRYPDELELSG